MYIFMMLANHNKTAIRNFILEKERWQNAEYSLEHSEFNRVPTNP